MHITDTAHELITSLRYCVLLTVLSVHEVDSRAWLSILQDAELNVTDVPDVGMVRTRLYTTADM